MNYVKSLRETDFEKLGRLKIFSWLSPSEVKALGGSLKMQNFQRNEVIFRESTVVPDAHVLVSGIARVTCLNGRDDRITVALIAPGAIPGFPILPINRFDFRCEAYSNCRIGTMDWNGFESVTANGREAAFKKFHQNDLKHWYRLFLRSSGLLNLDLHDRVAITMLDLCDDFGIEDARGTLLKASFSHKDIASIVGASRPRVTEHLGQMERDHYLVRQGRQFIVCSAKLTESLSVQHAARESSSAQHAA
jgi:CRP/FNR family transcriptional regulator, cyclic AMP receptor protein